VDSHVKSLRQKLGGSGDIVKTVRGVGYKVDAGRDA
jgi:DNA-binding response OmpR family regulator